MSVKVAGRAVGFTFAPAAGGANVCEVTIQVVDADGNAVQEVTNFLLWLSDAATGVGLTSTSASGTVTAKSASGTDLGVLTAKKALVAQSLANGSFVLEITDTSKTAFYVAAQVPLGPAAGRVQVHDVLATADYGA